MAHVFSEVLVLLILVPLQVSSNVKTQGFAG